MEGLMVRSSCWSGVTIVVALDSLNKLNISSCSSNVSASSFTALLAADKCPPLRRSPFVRTLEADSTTVIICRVESEEGD